MWYNRYIRLIKGLIRNKEITTMTTLYKTIGNKYNKSLSTKEIAVLIRKDIKELGYITKQGFKISVTSDYNSITINVREIPLSKEDILSKLYFEWNNSKEREKQIYIERWDIKYTEAYKTIYNNLKAIHNSYNFDDSEAMTDYFHVNYYGSVSMPYKY